MKLDNLLYGLFEKKARKAKIETLCIGLGYTAVTIVDGGIGISCTYFETNKPSSLNRGYIDFEGQPALGLLEKIRRPEMIHRTMAVALINALNYEDAPLLPEDRNNKIMFEMLGIRKGTKVAMVGYFKPFLKALNKRGALIEIIDSSYRFGRKKEFYPKLKQWAEILFLTSTSLLNNTTEEILGYVGEGVKTVMLGPSTPMVHEAFDHLPVHMLAGTVPIEKEKVLKAIRHGTGTPIIQKFSRKSYLSFF
jgi:hypothetical protein